MDVDANISENHTVFFILHTNNSQTICYKEVSPTCPIHITDCEAADAAPESEPDAHEHGPPGGGPSGGVGDGRHDAPVPEVSGNGVPGRSRIECPDPARTDKGRGPCSKVLASESSARAEELSVMSLEVPPAYGSEAPGARTILTGLPVLALLLILSQAALAQSEPPFRHSLPLVKPASNAVVQSFIRIINHSNQAGTVEIHAIDDSGRRFGPVSLDLNAKASVHFTSADLESGNAAKGLSGGVGDGDGDWRVELSTELDIEPLAYIRTSDGFLTSMHDLVVEAGTLHHHVPFFNPASNISKVSRLRLINPSDADARVEIYGLDDEGERSGDAVLTIPAGGARTVSAQELESGGSGLSVGLGDGTGNKCVSHVRWKSVYERRNT